MTNQKSALISGITGQDGAYLAKYLIRKKYKVYGMYRRSSTPNFWRLQSLGVFDEIKLIPSDLSDMGSIMEAITISEPDEIYNLGAQSFVGASFEQARFSTEVNGLGPLRMLEAIRLLDKSIKFYQASTSEIYGNSSTGEVKLNEQSRMVPISPYAASKLYAYNSVNIYREAYGLFASNGILFNHESPLRGLEFVTRKVTNSVAKIALGLQSELILGNLESKRDWGYAPEYVEAMWLMMQQDQPGDFVIASGETHSIQEMVIHAFQVLGIQDYKRYVKIDQKYYRPLDIHVLIGDPTYAKEKLNWKPRTSFKGLIELMVKSDYSNWEKYLAGKLFPWDAPNYPSEANIITRVAKL
jgi:GDPmannose 4,6-dehydratase